MRNATAHHSEPTAHLPELRVLSWACCPSCILIMMSVWYRISPWLVRFGCPGCALPQILVNPGHLLMRLSRIFATVYPFVCYSHSIPLQEQKAISLCLFPKGAKMSNNSCWMNPFSKEQGDSVQRGKTCNSRFPKLNSYRLKGACPAQCKRIYKSWKEHWKTCSRLWSSVKSN